MYQLISDLFSPKRQPLAYWQKIQDDICWRRSTSDGSKYYQPNTLTQKLVPCLGPHLNLIFHLPPILLEVHKNMVDLTKSSEVGMTILSGIHAMLPQLDRVAASEKFFGHVWNSALRGNPEYFELADILQSEDGKSGDDDGESGGGGDDGEGGSSLSFSSQQQAQGEES